MLYDNQDRLRLQAAKFIVDYQGTVSGAELVWMLGEMECVDGLSPVAAGMWLGRTGAFRRVRRHSGNTWRPTRRFKALLKEELRW
jgi:hypothetical protein